MLSKFKKKSHPKLYHSEVTSIGCCKLFFLVAGRNAWHSTWINRYTPGSLQTSFLGATSEAEKRRVQGTTFVIKEIPALKLSSKAGHLLVRQLQALGYQVLQAPDGRQGLETLLATPGIDLLLTDVIMPGGMNGLELSKEARKQLPALKVLFTSGYSENVIAHSGRLDPGVELLSKPFRRQELAAKVRKVLDG